MSIIGECFVTSWGEASSSQFGDNDITTRELAWAGGGEAWRCHIVMPLSTCQPLSA